MDQIADVIATAFIPSALLWCHPLLSGLRTSTLRHRGQCMMGRLPQSQLPCCPVNTTGTEVDYNIFISSYLE